MISSKKGVKSKPINHRLELPQKCNKSRLKFILETPWCKHIPLPYSPTPKSTRKLLGQITLATRWSPKLTATSLSSLVLPAITLLWPSSLSQTLSLNLLSLLVMTQLPILPHRIPFTWLTNTPTSLSSSMNTPFITHLQFTCSSLKIIPHTVQSFKKEVSHSPNSLFHSEIETCTDAKTEYGKEDNANETDKITLNS